MKSVKKFLIYFPVLLVSIQVLVNIYALIDHKGYESAGFYLNTFIGTNILFSLFLVAFTFSFNFCAVSRFSAIAECLFGLNFLIVQEDNLYNIIFQVIVGAGALLLTYNFFIKKFPMCKISLTHKFFAAIFLTGSCSRGVDKWESDVKESIAKKMNYEREFRHFS